MHASAFHGKQAVPASRHGPRHGCAMARPIAQQGAIDKHVDGEPPGGPEDGRNANVVLLRRHVLARVRAFRPGPADPRHIAIRERGGRIRPQQGAHGFHFRPGLRLFNR
ncbi:hypothetical protein D3C87_1728280 [compost metagenome]